MIDRDKFFARARAKPFNAYLEQGQVDGLNAILDAWEIAPGELRYLAYELATVFHECAAQMVPIREYGRGAGRAYGHPDPVTRQVYYGRGYVQLTWRANYVRMAALVGEDLVNHPDLALEPNVAAKIMFVGMEQGLFTGMKLSDYFTDKESDWLHARRIINGMDRAAEIAVYAQEFNEALS